MNNFTISNTIISHIIIIIMKGEAVPLQVRSGPEGSRNLRLPDFSDNGTGWW